MPATHPTRRTFCTAAALTFFGHHLGKAQQPTLYASARPDVAAIDHDRILAAANKALTISTTPLTALKSPGNPHDFYSEAEGLTAFTAHRDAVFNFSRRIADLAAAFHLTHDDRYAAHAALHLHAWFIDPATRMTPDLTHAATIPGDPKPHFEGILDTVFFAELAQAIPFLASSNSLSTEHLSQIKAWFAAYLQWLTTSRLAALAREQKDHHGTSWLLQSAAYARLTQNEAVLSDLRHQFKTVTLRAQIVTTGTFPHELTTPYPYRNSLFNLDLLAASCLLLSSQFESLWEFELQDGPGLRIVIARHVPYIQSRGTWPYRADLDHFDDLPVRNPSLLFAARAYTRPEYAELWKTLNPDPTIPEIARTFPISQPLLWTTRPHLPKA
ncbi:alginate lyase family protein [Granulicella arctica]|uniref:Alginate lyase domain-containing protein n=1 Tax=Granulicella arctica TaxID=940613 RepID=A0A7Y9TU21_9BACT|nr:alginate lyase family protein [Granulicella arctica]NYF80503.1 hypothetical protein [Granulicella arctica]